MYATENKMKVPDVLFYDNHQVSTGLLRVKCKVL